MTLEVIDVGFDHMETMSLKLARERLGLWSCLHVEEVLNDSGQRGLSAAARR